MTKTFLITLIASLVLPILNLSAQVDKAAVDLFVNEFATKHEKNPAEVKAILDANREVLQSLKD